MTEHSLLRVLLLVSLIAVPFAAERPLHESFQRRAGWHLGAWSLAAIGLWTSASILSVGWLLFCAVTFAQFLRQRAQRLRSPTHLAQCVPHLFSLIAGIWLVGGAMDLGILGYGPIFSYYAALHGNVLGVILLGALAALARSDGPYRNFYVGSVFVCFASFLLIAVGIDQLRALKPIGVVGLSVTIPLAQALFINSVRRRNRVALALGGSSLLGLVCTMVLAWRHELSMAPLPNVLGVRSMVAIHGVLNTVVVAPCLLLAVALDHRRTASGSRAGSA